MASHSPLLPQTHLQLPADSDLGRKERSCIWKVGLAVVVAMMCVCLLGILSSWYETKANYGNSHKESDGSLISSSNESLNFLVVGDWGRKGLYNQSDVSIQMGRIGEEIGIEFVISAGDNFYDTGLRDEDDPAFTTSFTNVYTAPSLQTTWYTVLGNHDYMGDALSQLSEVLVRRDPRWFCQRTFQIRRSLCWSSNPGMCSASVEFFFIDTTPFIDAYWSPNASHTFDWRGLAPREEQVHSQLENLSNHLDSSNATWRIVVGHHTIRSIGHHGDLPELVQQLLPVLEKHKVDIYINGHDHNLQHIKRVDSSVHLFTSGGGSKAYGGLRPYTENDGIQFAYDGQGFLAVSMKSDAMSLTFHDVFGDALYTSVLAK